MDELNAGGGVNGMQVRLVVKDTRSDTAQAAVVAQELVDEGVAAMIVSCDLDPAVASGTVAQAAEVPAASSCASTPTLPAAVGPYMFSNYTADNLQGTVLAASCVPCSLSSLLSSGAGNVPVQASIPYNTAPRPQHGENCGPARDVRFAPGEVPEWPNGADSKSVVPSGGPGVRIPPSPPIYQLKTMDYEIRTTICPQR